MGIPFLRDPIFFLDKYLLCAKYVFITPHLLRYKTFTIFTFRLIFVNDKMKKTQKKKEILKRLGEIIDEAHISQAGIARQMGTSPALISRWKSGDITPSIASYEKLCKILNVNLDYLLTGNKNIATNTTSESDMYRAKFEKAQNRIIELLDENALLKEAVKLKKVSLNKKAIGE